MPPYMANAEMTGKEKLCIESVDFMSLAPESYHKTDSCLIKLSNRGKLFQVHALRGGAIPRRKPLPKAPLWE